MILVTKLARWCLLTFRLARRVDPTELETTRTRLLEAAFDLTDAARTDATRRAYATDWNDFTRLRQHRTRPAPG